MKILITVLFLCLIPLTSFSLDYNINHLYVTSEFAPPHNEPVIGNKVARYRLQFVSEVEVGRLIWSPKLTAWGVNTWRPSSVVEHFPKSYGNSDWGIENVRFSHTQNLDIKITDNFAITTEYYMPLNRKSWGGHGLERHYYWLVGVKVGW